jgi:DinB superfamily
VTQSTDETDRIRGYLIAQANKLTPAELVAKLRADTAPLQAIGAAVPIRHFAQRPGPDDWSAAEVYTHILDMNERGARAIEGILDEGVLPSPITDTISGQVRAALSNAEDYWQTYLVRREALLERVSLATGDEHLDTKIVHNQFGALNWREWLLFMRVHDLDHMRQLQAITAHFSSS